MTAKNRTDLKALFQNGDTPTGADFTDLIDSFVNLADTTVQAITSDISLPSNSLHAYEVYVDSDFSAPSIAAGNLSVSNLIITGNIRYSTNASAVAFGTTQASAVTIAAVVNRFSTVTSTERGTIIPTGSSNSAAGEIFIFNDNVPVLKVYPPVGGRINNLSTNTPYDVSASVKVSIFRYTDITTAKYFTK